MPGSGVTRLTLAMNSMRMTILLLPRVRVQSDPPRPARRLGGQRTVSVTVLEAAALRLPDAGRYTRYLFTALTVGLIVNV